MCLCHSFASFVLHWYFMFNNMWSEIGKLTRILLLARLSTGSAFGWINKCLFCRCLGALGFVANCSGIWDPAVHEPAGVWSLPQEIVQRERKERESNWDPLNWSQTTTSQGNSSKTNANHHPSVSPWICYKRQKDFPFQLFSTSTFVPWLWYLLAGSHQLLSSFASQCWIPRSL